MQQNTSISQFSMGAFPTTSASAATNFSDLLEPITDNDLNPPQFCSNARDFASGATLRSYYLLVSATSDFFLQNGRCHSPSNAIPSGFGCARDIQTICRIHPLVFCDSLRFVFPDVSNMNSGEPKKRRKKFSVCTCNRKISTLLCKHNA